MYTSDTFDLPGLQFQRHIGLCWGLTVVSVGLGKGIIGSLKTLEAGEVPEFTDVVDAARRTAIARMIEHGRHSLFFQIRPVFRSQVELPPERRSAEPGEYFV